MRGVIATPGSDGDKIERLLSRVQDHGAKTIYSLAEDAAKGQPTSLTRLAETMTNATATANLLGRAKIRHRINRMTKFSEGSDFAWFAEDSLDPMTPLKALEYFQSKAPISPRGLTAFDATMQGQGFQMAATTEVTILRKVHEAIQRALETGESIRDTPRQIEEILASAGIHPKKGYAQQVFRTNLLEAYRQGAWEEYQSPELDSLYPVWQYIGIVDGRQRHKHEHLSVNPVPGIVGGLFFPRDMSFFDVRGRDIGDVANCRCDWLPVYRRDWDALQGQGATVADLTEIRKLNAA